MKIIVILSLLILTGAGFALSEDQTATTNTIPAPVPSVEQATPQESSDSPNTQWVWGEVTGVDAQNKSVSLKYLDYETDQEKDMAIATDELTSYDNANSLGEIQPKDNISVDYVVKDGKNIAKTIGLEKAENAPAAAVTPQVGEGNDVQTPQTNQ